MKKLMISLIVIGFFLLIFLAYSWADLLNGFTDGDINVLAASANDIVSEAKIKVSDSVGNIGDDVEIKLYSGKVTKKFKGRDNAHKRSCTYIFEKAVAYIIYIDGKPIREQTHRMSLEGGNQYEIKGGITFRWKVSKDGLAAGFPQYYYRTAYTEAKKIAVPSDLDQVTEKDELPIDLIDIEGKVLHSPIWEEKRIEKSRGNEMFWAGEEFFLEARIKSEENAEKVTVSILGTDFNTELNGEDNVFTGHMWNEQMLEMWRGKKDLELEFMFTGWIQGKAYTDFVKVVIHDTEYWKLHRRE